MKRRIFTKEELSESFRFNKNGELERLFRGLDWRIIECKANDGRGYCRVSFGRFMIRYHTIIWILTHGTIEDVDAELDHIDGNRSNNRIDNLRLVTRRENCQNKKTHRNGRLQGCHFCKQNNKWQAYIVINSKRIALGYYDNELEAHNVYSEALTMLDKSVEEIKAYFGVAQFSSGFKGVTYDKRGGKWMAQITIHSKQINLGYYDTEQEAHKIYLKACELMTQYVDAKQFRELLGRD